MGVNDSENVVGVTPRARAPVPARVLVPAPVPARVRVLLRRVPTGPVLLWEQALLRLWWYRREQVPLS